MLLFARGTHEYEWYDHNSLLGDIKSHQALAPLFMDRELDLPARAEMEAALDGFAARGNVRVRYGCEWESTRSEGDGRFVLVTSRRRVPLPRVRVRYRHDRSLAAADPRPRRPPITPTPGPRSDTKERTSSSSASGTRASRSPRASSHGEDARAGLTPARRDGRPRVLAASPAIPPAVRRARARRLGEPRRRRLDRARRASRGRIPDPRPTGRPGRESYVRGGRCDRRDRIPHRRSATSPTSALPRSTTDGSRRRRRTGRASPCRGSSSPGT